MIKFIFIQFTYHSNKISDTNMNCKCVGQAPGNKGDSIGKTCEGSTSKGFAGEPFCGIRSSEKHACTDAQRDNAQAAAGTLGAKTSNWYYSTMPCISKQSFHERFQLVHYVVPL